MNWAHLAGRAFLDGEANGANRTVRAAMTPIRFVVQSLLNDTEGAVAVGGQCFLLIPNRVTQIFSIISPTPMPAAKMWNLEP